jgi:hypothetical protein
MDYDSADQQQDYAVMMGDEVLTKEQFEAKQRQEIEALNAEFSRLRDKWVQHRAQSGVENRWRKATDLYFGEKDKAQSEFENTLRNGPPARKSVDGNRSKVVINIVRPKVDQAIARMCEILLPVDDRNWGIKPTPIPEIADMQGDNRMTVDPQTGQPTGMTANDEAKLVVEAAKKSAEGMELAIDDSLTECNFNGESRKVVENGVRLGSGIVYGPFPARQTSKVWLPQPDGTQVLQFNETIVPASMSLDPWDVFFDPACGNDHQRGRGFFIRRNVTRKELRQLVGMPGYDDEAIRDVLRTNPCRVRVAEGRILRDIIQEDSYELWQYHGEIEPDEMERLTAKAGDPLTDVSFGVLVIVNDRVIGAMESWVADQTLPVDVWNWRKADDSPFGYGLPDELENQQRVVNSSWRQVMDNGRTSLGGQIVMKKGMVIPSNGSYEITPNKIWLAKDDLEDVRQAFSVFEFNSHLQELLAIAQAAMQFADMETSMPQILGGSPGSAPETVGGMVMLYNNANTVLRQRVKLYDDCVTKPHIGRYYDWNMANNPDPDIKGDFEVDARGSTALIERDIQNQALLNLANITNNARYVPHLKEREELKAILKAFKVNPEEIMKTEEEFQQEQQAMAEQGAPQDPKIMAAQMDMQMKEMDIKDRQAQREFEMARNQKELEFRERNLQYNAMREQAEAEQHAIDARLQRELGIAKMAQDGQMSREELERKERLEMIKIQDGRERFNAEAALRIQTGAGI